MTVPASIKRPDSEGAGFRDESNAETRPAIFTPTIELDMYPNREIGQPPAWDGLLSRRGRVPASILVDPRLNPFHEEPPDDFFWQLDASRPWNVFTVPTGNLAQYLGIPGADPVALYNFTSTDGLFRNLANPNLANLTASAGVLYDRSVPGLWNGTDLTSIRTCEFPGLIGTGSSAPSNSDLNVTSGSESSVAVITVFRAAPNEEHSFGGVGKYDASAGGNIGGGYGWYFTAGDVITSEIGGTTTGHFTRSSAGSRDGAVHFHVMAFSRASSSLTHYSDMFPTNTPTVSGTIGSLTNTSRFCVGKQHVGTTQPYIVANFTTTGHWQPFWVAVLTGSAAEVMFTSGSSTAMLSWWNSIMNRGVPGAHATRPGSSGQQIGYAAGTGALAAFYGPAEVEFTYHPAIDNERNLGVALRGFSLTNTLAGAYHVSGAAGVWALTGSTGVPRAADDPRGFRAGYLLHKTNVSGGLRANITAGNSNYFSVFVRRTGSAVPRLRAVNGTNGAVSAEVVCSSSLEGEWGLYRLMFGSGPTRIELHPSDPDDSSGSALFQYAAHYNTAAAFGSGAPNANVILPIGHQLGSAAISPPAITSTGSVVFDNFAEVDLVYVPLSRNLDTTNRIVWTNGNTGSNGRRVYLSQSNGNVVSEVRGVANNVLAPSVNFGADIGTLATVKVAWDSTGSFDLGYVITTSAGTTSSFGPSGSTDLSASATSRPIDLGSGSAPAGIVSLLKVYAKTKIM